VIGFFSTAKKEKNNVYMDVSRHLTILNTSILATSVPDSCGARPWGRCVAFRVFQFSASVRGLGTGVDVGVAALDLSALSVIPSCLGRGDVGSCGARPQDWCVEFGLFGFR
jgi:hypothetical protein